MEDQVTLPAYTDKVRELIKHDRTDEAIAICKHILTYYPKYIDAYRQMGEAFLEKGDLDGAKDLFRRVLSADPENVVAYTGLSIVFERQQLIDEAIWHLERAYELTPGNSELQKELLRLYNEADVKSHARLKLTPGALGRIYAQEGLYAQALHEFRSIIAMAPSRFDIRVALSETFWRMGHLSEATQVAQNILEELPYCIKANLILGAAWKQVGLPESDQYLERVQVLDPTNQTAVRLMGLDSPLHPIKAAVPPYTPSTPVPPPTVTAMPDVLTHVEQKSEMLATGSPVDQATEVQIETAATLQAESSAELSPKPGLTPTALPPWLQTPFPSSTLESESKSQEVQTRLADLRHDVQPPIEETVEPSDVIAAQVEATSQELVTQEPTAQGVEPSQNVPAWLSPSTSVESEEPVESAMPSWIQKEPAVEPTKTSEESLPAWLSELSKTQTPGLGEENLPSWISPSPTEPTQPVEETLPPWMSNVAAPESSEPEKESAPPIIEQPNVEPVESKTEELPAWIAEKPSEPMVEKAPQVPALPIEPVEKVEPETTQPAPSWLENLAKSTEAPAELPSQEIVSPTLNEPEQINAPPMPPAVEPVSRVPPTVAEMPRAGEKQTPQGKRSPKGYSNLVTARDHRAANRLDDALKEYDYVVQHAPRLVNQVIDDLEAIVLQRLDAPLEAHRILGDAYTRADRLSEALEQYRFVLEHSSK